MGKYHNGILGGFNGKIGSVTGYGVNSKSIVRSAQNVVKVNNFGGQVSVKGWQDNLRVSFSQFLQQWVDNMYVYLDDYQDFYKDSLLKVSNHIRHKEAGIYDCESLFGGGVPYLSGYSADYNTTSGVLTQQITSMNLSLGSIPAYGVLDAMIGLSGIWDIDQGFTQAGVNRTLTRDLLSASAPQYVYLQSIITEYGTANLALCPPKVIKVY